MKNLLLSSALLLTCVSGFAQLTVKPVDPSGTRDAYLYVRNTVLYVKGSINLEKNHSGPNNTEASIYLREGAQLIQDGESSTNTGDGFLSVQQNAPESNAYAYNYWCSPVGNPAIAPIGNTNFGINFIYEDKNLPLGVGTAARKADNISGREGYTDPNLTISRRWITHMMEPAVEAYASYTRFNDADGAVPGYGFTMKGTNLGGVPVLPDYSATHAQTYEFRGRPNNGTLSIDVMGPAQATNNPNQEAQEMAKMTLTGNPYPSALDLNKLFYDSENGPLNCIYFYDEDRSVMSHLYNQKPYGYGVWVPGPEDTTSNRNPVVYHGFYTRASFFIWNANGGHNGSSPGTGLATNGKRYAPVGQGFMFVGGGPENETQNVKIKNAHRVFEKSGPYSIFQRTAREDGNLEIGRSDDPSLRGPAFETADGTYPVDTRTPQLRLYVVFDNALSRDLLLVFHPQATDGYDRGFDGLSPMGMKSEAYFPIGPDSDRRAYAIQGLNYEPRKMIPLTFKLHKTSQVEVRAVEEIRKPYERVYLFDRQENVYRPLTASHSTAGTFTLPAGNYEDRFFLVFRNATLNPRSEDLMDGHDRAMADINMFQNNSARQLEISNPDGYRLKEAYMYDMSGKLVLSEKNLGDASSYYLYTGNLSDGMYLVKLVTSDDIVIDYKSMVMNK